MNYGDSTGRDVSEEIRTTSDVIDCNDDPSQVHDRTGNSSLLNQVVYSHFANESWIISPEFSDKRFISKIIMWNGKVHITFKFYTTKNGGN